MSIRTTGKMRAYIVTIMTWPGIAVVYPGMSPGRAKSAAFHAAWGAGYNVSFTSFRARRSPQFDPLAKAAEGKMPYCLGWRENWDAWGCLATEVPA